LASITGGGGGGKREEDEEEGVYLGCQRDTGRICYQKCSCTYQGRISVWECDRGGDGGQTKSMLAKMRNDNEKGMMRGRES
jgi:hypothetical protein